MPQIVWESEPVARIHHECSVCGRTINPGEKYHRSRSIAIDYDTPYTFKECRHCIAFLARYLAWIDFDPDNGYTEEDIAEWEPPPTNPVAVQHKRRWSIGWRHGRDLYPPPGEDEFAEAT